MATSVTRNTSTGNLLINGSFDEVTYSGNVTFANKVTSDTVYVSGSFDEVTYNTVSPTVKNLYQYTQVFNNAYWAKSGTLTITPTAAVTAPDGSSTAQLATVGGVGTFPWVRVAPGGAVVPATEGITYTVSAYVKYINQQYMTIVNEDGWTGNLSVRFDILNGIVGTPSANIASAAMTSVGSGWWRIRATFVPIPSGITYWNPQPIRVGQFTGANFSGSQVYIWGAQLEASTTATIYQGIAAANTLVTTGMTQRVDSVGNMYVSGSFDEVTGFV
jgi:hypothetical protein